VRIVVALAASTGYALYSTDFSQAFVNAPETNPHKYIVLPATKMPAIQIFAIGILINTILFNHKYLTS
jgi:hypothetical protein